MSRPLSPAVFVLLAVCGAQPAVAQHKPTRPAPITAASPADKDITKVSDVAWDDPGFQRYFRYQKHLTAKGLSGETSAAWARLEPAERIRKVADGEKFLQDRLATLLQSPYLSADDMELLKAVWGDAATAGVSRVAAARRLQDPAQVELALKSVKGLVGKAAEQVDWNSLFDGTQPDAQAPPDPRKVDPLAVPGRPNFLEAIASPEVLAVLASRKTYADFLGKHNVPAQAQPAMLAMYDVLTKAGPAEKKELSHILPTVVHFLKEGKPVVVENMPGAYGFAVPGAFDTAEKVAVTPLAAKADPVVVADVLTHEFQHVYDMYTGRYYSLDSELRGFKSNVMFYRALRTASPQKVAAMQSSDDETTRHYALNWADLEQKHAAGAKDFCDKIAFGHGYNHYHGAVFSGRLPLREAVQDRAAPAQLAAHERMRDEALAGVVALEQRQKLLLTQAATNPTRANEKELQKVTEDLANARRYHGHYEREVVIERIRINRMRSEVAWLDKKSAGKKDPDPYDMHLQVDEEYVRP